MAKKTSKTAENKKAKTTSTRAKKQTQAPVVDTKPTLTPKLIVAQRKFNRWYVFKGVAPKDNVGCGCKTAQSAIRYMHLLKAGTVPLSPKTSTTASLSRPREKA